MARKLFHLGLLGVLIAGAATYAVRTNWGPGRTQPAECARRWLGLSGNQCNGIRNEDPHFQEEAQALSQSLQFARRTLADLLADPNSTDDVLRAQAQTVLDAHHRLMRHTVNHLLVVRAYTDVSQCGRLNALCADVMHSGQGRGYGRQGRGPGRGMGRGRGMQYRWRRGRGALAPALRLTEAQQQAAGEIDPNYTTDAAALTEQVRTAYQTLAGTLQDINSPDESVQQALDHFIDVQTMLEERTVDYVLGIRPMLSVDQQQRLIGLSHGGGRRWRGGRS